eukprot:jgi/Mesvir1/18029/Mv09351-RA.1
MLEKLHGDVVGEIEAAWDLVLGMALKLRIGISYDKYQALRQMLSGLFDQATQSYLPRTTSAGAHFPKLPTKHRIVEEMKKMLEEMDIMQSEDGTIVTSSLLAALLQDLRADPSGFEGRTKLLYQILGDGAKMARGFKALSIAGRLMRHQGQPGSEVWMHQSPSKLQELVMSKGRDDDYKISIGRRHGTFGGGAGGNQAGRGGGRGQPEA